jgi:hypothetical protein
MKMIIDECHLIPNFSRIFKPAVILDIIKASKMFKSVTLVSASMGELDHYQELFGNMDVHHYVWDDIRSYDFTAKRYYKSKDMNDDLARAIISIVKANKIQIQQGKPIQEIALFYNHISSIGINLDTVQQRRLVEDQAQHFARLNRLETCQTVDVLLQSFHITCVECLGNCLACFFDVHTYSELKHFRRAIRITLCEVAVVMKVLRVADEVTASVALVVRQRHKGYVCCTHYFLHGEEGRSPLLSQQ